MSDNGKVQTAERTGYDYLIRIETADAVVVIDWGFAPNWLETEKKYVEAARRVTLVPRCPESKKRTLTAVIDPVGDWDVRVRTVGRLGRGNQPGAEVKIYKFTAGEVIHWIYPDGSVELGPEPSYVGLFLQEVP